MKALMYLITRSMKNRIRKLMRKKGLFIFYLVIVVFAIVMLTSSMFMDTPTTNHKDVRLLYTIVLGLSILFLYSSFSVGFSQGGTLFSMSDVGLLFTAPISPKRILIYGLIKQLGTTLLSAIFIIFQMNTLNTHFNIGTGGILAILFTYGSVLFFCQLMSITCYVYSNGNVKRQQFLKLWIAFYFACLILWFGNEYMKLHDVWKAICHMIDSKIFLYVPVLGWNLGLMKGVIESDLIITLLSLGQYTLFGYLMILFFAKKEADFYESVLVRTENNYQILQDMKEGKRNNTQTSNIKLKVKVKEVGIRRGTGASTLFFKQIVEMKRESKIPFLATSSISIILVALAFSYFNKFDFVSYLVFGIIVYIQFIFSIVGRLDRELHKPYIYLIPESSIKKLVYSCLPNTIQPSLEGLISFVIVWIVGKQPLLLCLFLAIAVSASGTLFSTIPVLFLRIFGEKPSRVFTIFIELFLVIIILSPGIIISVVKSISLSEELLFLGTIPYILNCFLFSALILFLCRNIFNHAESGC